MTWSSSSTPTRAPSPTYDQLWQDIRECIDLAHRDGSIKSLVAADLPTYIERDPGAGRDAAQVPLVGQAAVPADQLGLGLHRPGDELPAGRRAARLPQLAQLLRRHRRQRRQAGVLHRGAPLRRAGRRRAAAAQRMHDGPFVRGRVYAGGNVRDFEERARARGAEVLYIGDHIYGDMLRSRKSSAWRTAMVLQELEHEVEVARPRDARAVAPGRPRAPAAPPGRRDQRQADGAARPAAARRSAATALRPLRRGRAGRRQAHGQGAAGPAARRAARQHGGAPAAWRQTLDAAFNPHWGPLFREGHEISKFGEQVEAYACVYTSRVSNFRFYSPNRHFRGPRDRMPHER